MTFKEFLKKKLISPAEASRMTGLSRGAMSNWVNGKNVPYTQNLRRLVEVFGEEVLDCFKED